jgi:hypothetical protein
LLRLLLLVPGGLLVLLGMVVRASGLVVVRLPVVLVLWLVRLLLPVSRPPLCVLRAKQMSLLLRGHLQ